MNTKSVVISTVLGAGIGVAVTAMLMHKQSAELDVRLNQSPPVVIVDFTKMVSEFPDGASPEEVEDLMIKTNDSIVRLRDAGYLVLDARAVLTAPQDLYMPNLLGAP